MKIDYLRNKRQTAAFPAAGRVAFHSRAGLLGTPAPGSDRLVWRKTLAQRFSSACPADSNSSIVSVIRMLANHRAGSIAKCESPTFAGVCPSETPLARTYRQLDLD